MFRGEVSLINSGGVKVNLQHEGNKGASEFRVGFCDKTDNPPIHGLGDCRIFDVPKFWQGI